MCRIASGLIVLALGQAIGLPHMNTGKPAGSVAKAETFKKPKLETNPARAAIAEWR